MEKINISREPGFIYDLIFVFVLRFNKEYCLSKNINYNKTSEDTEYFNKIYLDYANISDELLPFFYLKNEHTCLISQFYYDDYVNSFENDYGFSTLYKALSKKEKLKENLIKFYFPETMLEISEQKNSTEYICKCIRNSKYSDMLKCALYSFFIETEYTINKLLEEVLSVYESMKRKYENELEALVKFESNFKMKLIENYYNNVEMLDIKKYKSILVVPCLYCKNSIKYYLNKQKLILLVGIDYIEYLASISFQKCVSRLDLFGNAIAEKNRVDILNLMLEKEEITRKDLEQELKLTGTNSYYHLNLMIKANIIKTRTFGKNVYYSINKQSIAAVINMLEKYK